MKEASAKYPDTALCTCGRQGSLNVLQLEPHFQQRCHDGGRGWWGWPWPYWWRWGWAERLSIWPRTSWWGQARFQSIEHATSEAHHIFRTRTKIVWMDKVKFQTNSSMLWMVFDSKTKWPLFSSLLNTQTKPYWNWQLNPLSSSSSAFQDCPQMCSMKVLMNSVVCSRSSIIKWITITQDK